MSLRQQPNEGAAGAGAAAGTRYNVRRSTPAEMQYDVIPTHSLWVLQSTKVCHRLCIMSTGTGY